MVVKDNTYDYTIELIRFHKLLKFNLKKHSKTLSKSRKAEIHEQMYTVKKQIREIVEGV